MNINGKANLFVKHHKTKDATFTSVTTTLSNKDTDGKYHNMTLEVKFPKEFVTMEKLNKMDENSYYPIEIKEGFLTFREYEKDGKTMRVPQVVITKGKFGKPVALKTKDNDELPF